MNASQASNNSAHDEYSSRRFVSVGTRSALAIRTVASDPPFDSGSAGTHVATDTP